MHAICVWKPTKTSARILLVSLEVARLKGKLVLHSSLMQRRL